MYPGAHVAAHGEKPAVVMSDTGEVLTYAALEERSVRLAHAFHDAGLRVGDSVALVARNSPRCHEVYWAALRSGLYVTAVDWHLSLDEMAYVLRDCGAKAVVVDAGLGAVTEGLARMVPGVRCRLAFTDRDEPLPAGHDDYESVLAGASDVPFEVQPSGADMGYSSGTTGRPKGVRPPLQDRQVSDPGDRYFDVFGQLYAFTDDMVYLSPAPLYHAAPLRFTGMVHMAGGTVVVMRRFDAEEALRLVERHRVTHSQWVPTMFVRMLKLPDEVRERYDVSSLRYAVHAAAPCPVDVKQRMIQWWGPILHEYYSSTEAIGVTIIGPEDWLAHPGSVGRAALGVLHVCDDTAKGEPEVATGVDGLVYFERETMPFAYHNDPDKTRAAQHPQHGNWATNGDIGHVDDDGYLYLTDRKAFMIISGGVNIYPQEVENALTLHPAVHDVAVIGVPDDEMGEVVKAVVQPADGVEGTPELGAQLIEHVRSQISPLKAPQSVDFVDSLPRTATGKLQKAKVRTAYLADGRR